VVTIEHFSLKYEAVLWSSPPANVQRFLDKKRDKTSKLRRGWLNFGASKSCSGAILGTNWMPV